MQLVFTPALRRDGVYQIRGNMKATLPKPAEAKYIYDQHDQSIQRDPKPDYSELAKDKKAWEKTALDIIKKLSTRSEAVNE
jgi:hypothetical protein